MASVHEKLGEWGFTAPDVTLCTPQNLALPLQKFTFAEAARWFDISGHFAADCEIWLNPAAFPPGAKTPITALNPAQPKQGIKIAAMTPVPRLQIFIGGDDCRIFTGAMAHFVMHAMLWEGTRLAIGDAATCNGARAILQRSTLIIGSDCMLSDEILLQTSQQHTLVDLTSMSALNRLHETTIIGDHVWLGRRATVMPGVTIGRGAILAAGAVAARDIPECTVAAGVPAAVIRENVSWCRNDAGTVDAAELAAAGISPPR
jgi:acetyltransferase-like isoleucine patch superfamily enzyme